MNPIYAIILIIGTILGNSILALNIPPNTNVKSYTEGYLQGNCDGALHILSQSYPNATCISRVSSGTDMEFFTTMEFNLNDNN